MVPMQAHVNMSAMTAACTEVEVKRFSNLIHKELGLMVVPYRACADTRLE